MLVGGRGFGILDRLDVRLVTLICLALLPIGIIAMVQTYRVISDANEQFDASLVSTTRAASTVERETIMRGREAAVVGASVIATLRDDPAICNARMADMVERSDILIFAGVIGLDGIVSCGSDGVGRDVSDAEIYLDYIARRAPTMVATTGRITGRSVIVISEPLLRDGQDDGYFAVSVAQMPPAIHTNTPGDPVEPLETVTFNARGEVLTAREGRSTEDVERRLPIGTTLLDLVRPTPFSFRSTDTSGETRIYAVAPLLPGEIYTLAIWSPDTLQMRGLTAMSAVLFPLLMWLVSIAVAYFAVHLLVTRHIRDLRRRIRAFSATRRLIPGDIKRDTPSELREVIVAFQRMTDQIVHDEADLENSLREKDVLLREVHHRVKNNLQLIASMTNMQLRKTVHPETRFVLRRLQDRVLGLATIHRYLYEASVLTRIDAARLLSDLTRQILQTAGADEAGIEVKQAFDSVGLYPDQAVPLSLLMTEALTNALKYIGRPDAGSPWIDLTLTARPGGDVVLRIANSTGPALNQDEDLGSTGLGTQLIDAFTMQLNATLARDDSDGRHVLSVTFRPSDFSDAA